MESGEWGHLIGPRWGEMALVQNVVLTGNREEALATQAPRQVTVMLDADHWPMSAQNGGEVVVTSSSLPPLLFSFSFCSSKDESATMKEAKRDGEGMPL
jgi:hypothetical protein